MIVSNTITTECMQINRKNRSKRQVDTETWKPNANKRKRELELPYQGKVKSNDNSGKKNSWPVYILFPV